jgi:hypothetical protein
MSAWGMLSYGGCYLNSFVQKKLVLASTAETFVRITRRRS